MKEAPIPANEKQRLQALAKYNLLDTMPEESYDTITEIIASICDVPIALINLVDKDRTFLKSRFGIDTLETPRTTSFCSHTIASESDVMIVPDTRKDERFHDNPYVLDSSVAFYAGVSLIDKNGYKLGSLCVFDTEPRKLSKKQLRALKSMAKQTMLLFEERQQNQELIKTQKLLEERNQELKDFAGIVSHDLKAPLSNILMIASLLKEKDSDVMNQTSLKYLDYLQEAGMSLSKYIDGMLNFYRSDELANEEFEDISYVDLVEDIITMIAADEYVLITYSPELDIILHTSKSALQQILLNLVSNSIKYGDKETTTIHIEMLDNEDHYQISVEDNGSGIAPDQIDSVFKLFYTAAEEDRNGKQGTGIGLATTKRLLDQLHATIDLSSELGVGTEITIKIPKSEFLDDWK
jgi:signal transduction histidine kinase